MCPSYDKIPTTKEWVIIATERSKRPHNFARPETKAEKPPYKEDCPFCQGNERNGAVATDSTETTF